MAHCKFKFFYEDFETSNPPRVLTKPPEAWMSGCVQFTTKSEFLVDEHSSHFFASFPKYKETWRWQNTHSVCWWCWVLENSAMKVSLNEQLVYGMIAQVTGDNWGLNSILGYDESFSNCITLQVNLVVPLAEFFSLQQTRNKLK